MFEPCERAKTTSYGLTSRSASVTRFLYMYSIEARFQQRRRMGGGMEQSESFSWGPFTHHRDGNCSTCFERSQATA